LVEGSSSLAKKLGIPTIVIGLTIVAFGTSLPELVVNIISALKKSGEIAFGNIIGSNIANILLILGVTGIITNLNVERSTTWKEIPFSLLGVIILLIFVNAPFLDKSGASSITRSQGLILLFFFIIFLYYIFELAKKKKIQREGEKIKVKKYSSLTIFSMVLGGLIALYFGGEWTVKSAVSIAKQLGLSEYFIGLTIVAIGTSLPELFTSIVAGLKKNSDIAVGNVVGSNIFNIFWVLGVTALIYPIKLSASANLDLLFLLGATFLLFLFMFIGKKHELQKWQGFIFILTYLAYLISLIKRG